MSQSLRANLRTLPRTAWILYAGTFINRFGSFVVPFLILYLSDKGYSPAAAGAAVAAYGFGNLFSTALGGFLADRIGRRGTIALSMFSAAAALVALSQAEGLPLITSLIFLCGLTAELYRPAASALLADVTPEGQRLTAFAVYRLAINAGVAAGPAVAGLLARKSFFYIFLGDAITCVLYGIIALVALPAGRGGTAREERKSEFFSTIALDRPFLLFLVSSTLISFVFFQFESTFALHVRASGYSTAVYGALVSLNGIVIVFLELWMTTVTRRFHVRRVMALGYFLVGAGFAVNLGAPTIPLLVGGVLLWTMGEIVSSPVAGAFVADLAPAHLRGRYMGAWGVTWSLGLMLGPGLGSMIYAWSADALWMLCGALGILSAGLILIEPVRARATAAPHP